MDYRVAVRANGTQINFGINFVAVLYGRQRREVMNMNQPFPGWPEFCFEIKVANCATQSMYFDTFVMRFFVSFVVIRQSLIWLSFGIL